MMKLTAIMSALALTILLAGPARAHTHVDDEYTPKDKLARGLAGMTAGFLELPGNIAAEGRDHGAGAAATIGFAKGLGMIPVRELVGVFNFVTAPFEVPDGYRPIIQPEYPWQYFDGARSASFDRSVRD